MKLNQEEVFNDEETLTTNPNELFQNVNDNSDRKDLEQYKAMLHNLKDLILEEQEKLSLEYKFDKQWLIFDQAKITLFKLKEIENKMQNYEKERKEIENKLINLKKDYNTLEIEKTEFEDRFYNLNIKNKMLGQKLIILVDEKRKLEDQYNKLEKNKKEVEDRFYNLNIKNKMLGQKLIILVDEKRKLEDQYNKLEKNKKEVEEQLTKKENEYNKLEDEKNELQEKYDELETEKTKINNELTKNQEKYKQLEIKHNKLEDEKNELQYQYEELETEKAKINNELTKNQEKYKQLEIKHNKLEDEKNELQEKYNELQKEKETLEKEYQILQENYDLSQTKITELQKNITYLAKEKKEINDKFYEKNKKYNYLKNKQEKLEISMIQYYFDTWSLNNPFDLKNTINIDNTWYDVLIKMKEHMITYVPGVSEEIFNLNEWAGENESSLDIKLKNDGVKNINHSKIFLFDNFTFNLHFKNIDTKKTITEAFYEIEKYLQTWTKENPFDLRNEVTFENTFMDIIEVIRKRLYSEEGINEEIIYHIRWIIPSEVVGKKLKDINWKFQSIGINNPDNNESREIDIAFKNIYTKGKHVEDYWKIKNYLDKWGLMSKFDLRYRISAFDDTLLDLTKEIERRLVAEENFDKKLIKNIEWRGKSGSSIRQKIIRNEGEDGRYQNLQFRYLPFFDKWSDNIPVYFDNFTSKR